MRDERKPRARLLSALALALVASALAPPAMPARSHAAQDEQEARAADSSEAARRLSSRDPVERQRAAEELARLAAVGQRKLLEGYRLQEKDGRARTALDWALYRAGKDESLFTLVRALDSKHSAQAFGYLTRLEGPDALYVFLGRVNGNTLIKLLDVLARVGTRDTLERLKPFTASLDPGIAEAAKFAEHEITARIEAAPTETPKRQRKTGKEAEEEPTP